MATGGQDSENISDLDLSELNSELAEFSKSDDHEISESSLTWEKLKAEQEFGKLKAGSSIDPDFLGFISSSQQHLNKKKGESQVTRSAPTTPASVRARTQSTAVRPQSLLS